LECSLLFEEEPANLNVFKGATRERFFAVSSTANGSNEDFFVLKTEEVE